MSRGSDTVRILSVSSLVVLSIAAPAAAGTISLSWDPVDHPQLTGYRIYIGDGPGAYSPPLELGDVTSAVLGGLDDCVDHYVSVKAVNAAGVESVAFSNEVSGWPRPSVTSVSPLAIDAGQTVEMTISGANFQQGATVMFDDVELTAAQVTSLSCNQVVLQVEVAVGATLGAPNLKVVNPDQVFGEGSGLFAVNPDVDGPVIADLGADSVGATTATVSWTTDEPAEGQAYYRLQGQSTWYAAPFDGALAQAHAVTLEGLTPETTYEFYVASSDTSGNGTDSPQMGFTTLVSAFTYLRFEAEAGAPAAPFETLAAPIAFGGAWVELVPGTPDGSAGNPSGSTDYGFHVPYQANWYVWMRVYSPGLGDGWFEGVDGSPLALIAPGPAGQWTWVAARSWSLDAGLHAVTLGGQRAGARADRILITDDSGFRPTEEPADDATPPAGVTDATASVGDQAVGLSWTDPAGGDAVRVVVRYRDDGIAPVSPVDGYGLFDGAVDPGAVNGLLHEGLVNGQTYSYALFAIDAAGNAGVPATLVATPQVDPPAAVENLQRSDTL